MITQQEVKELFDYNPESGELFWKPHVKRVGGLRAGSLNGHGYFRTSIKRKEYFCHVIIWLLVYGYLPESDIDHIDRDPTNNKLNNLREVSKTCNQRNRTLNKNNRSGVKGVNYSKKNKSWQTLITVSGKVIYLGHFKDMTEAVAHRLAAEQSLNWSGCDTSSTPFLFIKNYCKEMETK